VKTFLRLSASIFLLSCFACLICAGISHAQDGSTPVVADGTNRTTEEDTAAEKPPTVEQSLAKLQTEIDQLKTSNSFAGDNAWMLTSAALVLLMTAPGLAMFYGGLVRSKNVLSVMMQCIFLMGMMTVVWGLWGYSFAFGGSNPYIGNGEFLFMQNLTMGTDENGVAPIHPALNIPHLTFMVFQGMFFIITPALICGAFAERMKFSAMVIFSLAWGTLIYCPLCHWVWDGGILAYGESTSWAGGALDFAGGTVVHISSGVSALLVALMIGKRIGFGSTDLRPHNMTYTAMGGAMLWVGWFGFNAGSAGGATDQAANAFVVTHFSAAAGCVGWATVEWVKHGKPSLLGAISGAIAGLVCITPASGFVQPMSAIVMGAVAGIVCYLACGKLKKHFGYDDSLDAFGIHGVGGTLGALLTGIFATTQVGGADGLFYDLAGGAKLMLGQTIAVLVTIAFSIVGTFVIIKLTDIAINIRVSPDAEMKGLDFSQHAEEGYLF
jgi:Amt family ammonium transporter